MMWIAVHLAFAALPFVLTAALYSRKRRFPAGEGDARHATPRPVNSTRSSCSSCCSCTTMPIRTDTPAASASCSLPGVCRIVLLPADGPVAARFVRPAAAFAELALAAVAIGFVPGLYPWPLLPPTAFGSSVLSLRAGHVRMRRQGGGAGRAEPPATSAVPHRYDHRAGLPHDADGGSSDISARLSSIISTNMENKKECRPRCWHKWRFSTTSRKSRRTKDENGSLLRPVGQGDGRIRLFVFEAPGL